MTVICYLCFILLLLNKSDKFTCFLCQMSVTRHGKNRAQIIHTKVNV